MEDSIESEALENLLIQMKQTNIKDSMQQTINSEFVEGNEFDRSKFNFFLFDFHHIFRHVKYWPQIAINDVNDERVCSIFSAVIIVATVGTNKTG